MMNREFIEKWIGEHQKELFQMSKLIWENPEVAFEEKFALKIQTELLRSWGFEVETGVYGVETAYKASFGSGGAVLAIAAEYDALPEIGHACGHNLICMSSIAVFGALCALMKSEGLPGRVVLLGTPGEESGGGKVKMLEKNCLDGVDAVLMAHPSFRTVPDNGSTGIRRFTVEFHGHAAHAAGAPELGLNALDAVLMLFNGINAWRQQLPESARIHGVVLNGGVVPNVIPEYASCRFFLRSDDEKWLDKIEKRFRDMVKGAELMSGTEAKITQFRIPYQSRKPNALLNERYIRYCGDQKMNVILGQKGRGSSDFGNFSRKCPGIHPYFAISECEEPIAGHSVEFREASNSEFAYKNALNAAVVLGRIGIDFLTDENFRIEVRKDFEASEK